MLEPLMLNIENKYKAFHISFYPHTSLTAGLNISEREIIQGGGGGGGRGCIYTSTHANEHVYWLQTRSPELQYHQSPSVRRRRGKKKRIYAPTPRRQSPCAQSIL